jgi:hypothetical protein
MPKPRLDAPISDNFNKKRKIDRATSTAAKKIAKLTKKKDRLQPKASKETESEDDLKFSYQMLKDMRATYKKLGGRGKLEQLMEDDKQLLTMFKELMKIESALLVSKLRGKEETQTAGQTVFVILKGLDQAEPQAADGIDVKQISRVLNPDGGKYDA